MTHSDCYHMRTEEEVKARMKEKALAKEGAEYLDDLMDISEAMSCMEEALGVTDEQSKKAVVQWGKELIERYG